jgi:hypothetical protein
LIVGTGGRRDDDAVGSREQVGGLDDRGVPEVRAEQGPGGDGADVERDHVMALPGRPRSTGVTERRIQA